MIRCRLDLYHNIESAVVESLTINNVTKFSGSSASSSSKKQVERNECELRLCVEREESCHPDRYYHVPPPSSKNVPQTSPGMESEDATPSASGIGTQSPTLCFSIISPVMIQNFTSHEIQVKTKNIKSQFFFPWAFFYFFVFIL